MRTVYLDHNGSAPLAAEVIEAMRPWFEECTGNPSSSHVFGRKAKAAIEAAREDLASMLGCETDEVYFTAGGTESNNLILRGVAEARGSGHIVTTAIEHPSVLHTCRSLEKRGFALTVIGVDGQCRIDPGELESALRPDTVLISVMLANNEVGTIQDFGPIGALAKARGITLHTDAAQLLGKQRFKVNDTGVDTVTLAGHKFNAPKGVGAVFIRRGTALVTQMCGAGHERGMRSGTQNTMGIVGLGAAAARFERDAASIEAEYRSLRDYFEKRVTESIEGARINVSVPGRLVNTSSIAILGTTSGDLLARCEGVAAAPGAACHKDHTQPSHVLAAMKLPDEVTRSTVRYSLGYGTTREDLDFAVSELATAAGALRRGA